MNALRKSIKKNTLQTLLLLITASSIFTGCGADLETDVFESNSPEQTEGATSVDSCTGVVSTNGGSLNIRNTPEISDNICAKLANQTPVSIALEQEEDARFLKIKTTECGNLEDKWVFASARFITLNNDCFTTGNEGGDNDGPIRDPDSVVEAPVQSPPIASPPVLEPITNASVYIENNLEKISVRRPLTRRGATGLVTVFKLPGAGEKSICDSKHIRGNRSAPHMGKDTLCAWTSIAQTWNETECADGSANCRIMLGDASFGRRQPSSWPHSTHRRGWCMDIWPMRKKGCGEKEVTWRNSCYDREATAKFVDLIIKNGADVGNQLFFNDPQIPRLRKLSNHDDHIHVCFKPSNNIVKRSCSNLTINRNTCPEFK